MSSATTEDEYRSASALRRPPHWSGGALPMGTKTRPSVSSTLEMDQLLGELGT